MGSETNSPSPSAKRSRDPEDDVYIDNLHSHKRYLSEIMASSLNGLTVGDQNSETILDSPARSESMFYLRDELSLQYSPMSEDLDDTRYCETPTHASCSSQPDSRPTSPVSPYRYKSLNTFCYSPPQPTSSCSVNPPSQPRHNQRGSDAEGRFPSSPSDICHSADLRRAALMRSVQMRVHHPGPSPFDLVFSSGQEPMHTVDQDHDQEQAEEPTCSYIKPLVDDEQLQEDYQIDGCASMGANELEFERKNPCRDLCMDKVESSKD